MDRLRIKLSSQELHEMNEYLGQFTAFTPAVFRMALVKPHEYSVYCALTLLLSRLHLRTSVMAIRSKVGVRLNVPAEEGHALVHAWLTSPESVTGEQSMHLRNIVGRIQQALA